jgi:hypothetical protein
VQPEIRRFIVTPSGGYDNVTAVGREAWILE